MSKNTELTLKQSKFLELYFDPDSPTFGNGVQTALKTYDTDNYWSASVIAQENLQKLSMRKEVLLELKNLGFNRLMDTADEGLEACKDGVPDHYVRHKYMSSVAKWLGLEEEKANVFNAQFNLGAPSWLDENL